MSKKYLNIGTMVEKRDRQTGKPILDKNGKKTYYIKRDSKSKIVINGVEVTGQYINVSRPTDKLDRLLEKGQITPKEHAEKVAEFEKGGDKDYIQFEFTAVEDV